MILATKFFGHLTEGQKPVHIDRAVLNILSSNPESLWIGDAYFHFKRALNEYFVYLARRQKKQIESELAGGGTAILIARIHLPIARREQNLWQPYRSGLALNFLLGLSLKTTITALLNSYNNTQASPARLLLNNSKTGWETLFQLTRIGPHLLKCFQQTRLSRQTRKGS